MVLVSNEAVAQQQIRLALARIGAQVWRNNVGACTDDTGRVIRYGLCNDSAQMNAQIKSSDLIGGVPITIQPHHVGQTFAILTAIECKRPGWHLTPGDKRGQAQKRFIDLVVGIGGFAGFATGPDDLAGILVK